MMACPRARFASRFPWSLGGSVILAIVAGLANVGQPATVSNLSHPRLYFTANEILLLREQRARGVHARIWKNLAESADWCLGRTPRAYWIAPVSPDPQHENLYDRFYAIMGDLAITEHLAFASALSGDPRYGEAARKWVLASCRAWQREADATPDGSKAYAVARLLKGVAVGYDVVHEHFTERERTEVRTTLTRIGQHYFTNYFATPTISGPGFHTHHAIVEWGSFGVTALALLGEVPPAQSWLDTTVTKFEQHLLPTGLAQDGAQVEGATFWASTMQYRLFFLDALRRVTGRDLFQKFATNMNADLALASIAAEKQSGYDQHHANVVLDPSYGQIDYYAPVLLFLAREYRRPICQYLALWDQSLGQVQKTRYVTPHGEQLLFSLGGYAYVWYDPSVAPKTGGEPLSYHFPSVDEAYARASWKPNDLMVGVRKGELVVHAGGQPVLIELDGGAAAWADLAVQRVEDDGAVTMIRCGRKEEKSIKIELRRDEQRLFVRRQGVGDWRWWCQGAPLRAANELVWTNQVRLSVSKGTITEWDPTGYEPLLAVGNGALRLVDPLPQKFPRATVRPASTGEITLEVRLGL
jgi:hypothetical protein